MYSEINVIEHAIIKNDQDLLDNVLRPYFKNTTYLKSTDIYLHGDPADDGKVTGKGYFEIPESCYINDTGHFNSVEFNICYNQIMYYVIAGAVKHKAMRVFHDWDLIRYYQKQLPDILIVNFNSTFKKPLNPRRFYGEIDFVKSKIKQRGSLIMLKTNCCFYNEIGSVNCKAEIDLAILNGNR